MDVSVGLIEGREARKSSSRCRGLAGAVFIVLVWNGGKIENENMAVATERKRLQGIHCCKLL